MFNQWDDSENQNQPDPGSAPAAPQGDPWTPQELAESQNWANQYYTSHQIPNYWGTPDDLANAYLQQRRNGVSHQDAMNVAPGLLGWDKYSAPAQGTETPNPTDNNGGGGGGGGGVANPGPTGGGSLIQPFTEPYNPAGSASGNPTPLPTIGGSVASIPGAPAFPTIPKFNQPTMAEAMNDDGYKFTLDQGDKNLQNWAAARGTLNDSSTAKALIDYGQGAATTQYGNVWQRNYDAYNTNTQNQYIAPWQAQYQNWVTGTVGPTMTNYQTQAANTGHLNDVAWQDNWNKWLQDWNQFRDQRDSTFSKQFQVATA